MKKLALLLLLAPAAFLSATVHLSLTPGAGFYNGTLGYDLSLGAALDFSADTPESPFAGPYLGAFITIYGADLSAGTIQNRALALSAGYRAPILDGLALLGPELNIGAGWLGVSSGGTNRDVFGFLVQPLLRLEVPFGSSFSISLSGGFTVFPNDRLDISSVKAGLGASFIFEVYNAAEVKEAASLERDILTLLLESTNKVFSIKKEGNDVVLSFSDILFEVNSDILEKSSLEVLIEIIQIVKKYKGIKVAVSGHTDNTGGDDYNLKLSENRARNVANSFIVTGVDPGMVSFKGYGKSRPVASNDTEDNRRKNRRVEIRLMIIN